MIRKKNIQIYYDESSDLNDYLIKRLFIIYTIIHGLHFNKTMFRRSNEHEDEAEIVAVSSEESLTEFQIDQRSSALQAPQCGNYGVAQRDKLSEGRSNSLKNVKKYYYRNNSFVIRLFRFSLFVFILEFHIILIIMCKYTGNISEQSNHIMMPK